jgi:hypothetical protein
MIHHIVVGEEAAKAFSAAQNVAQELEGEIHILLDDLQSGPLQKPEGQSFSAMRSAYWHSISNDPLSLERIADQERILMLSTELNKNPNDRAWIWIAPSATDICAYYWIIAHLNTHIGRLHILNTSNLPFLDAEGRVFYPTRLSELQPKEIVKARRLARPITPSELEIDQDAWNQLVAENAALRSLEGGKKLRSRPDDFYDSKILSCLGNNFQSCPAS